MKIRVAVLLLALVMGKIVLSATPNYSSKF